MSFEAGGCMSLKIYLLSTLCLLTTSKLIAQDQVLPEKKITISIEKTSNSMTISEEEAFALFKSLGVTAHEQSKITIHEEQNSIDLSCFDCIVEHVDFGTILKASLNERTGE